MTRAFPPAEVEVVRLDRTDQSEFTNLVSRLKPFDPKTEAAAFVSEAQLQSARLPVELRRALQRLRTDGEVRGGLLIRGIPLGAVPATPAHADLAIGLGLDATRALSVVAGALGEQFGFRPELSGHVIQDILPVPGFEDTQQSISSRALLELHCETVFTDARADFVALLCLRPDPKRQAATLISTAHDVLERLSPETIRTLRAPRFATTVDGSFLRGSGLLDAVTVQPITVLAGSAKRPRLRCDFAETTGMDDDAQRAVEELYAAADAAAKAVYLDRGDLLLIDNHSTFHGRTPFERTGDGTDRWLLRSFIARDLARSIAHRPGGGRIIDIDYTALVHKPPIGTATEKGA